MILLMPQNTDRLIKLLKIQNEINYFNKHVQCTVWVDVILSDGTNGTNIVKLV